MSHHHYIPEEVRDMVSTVHMDNTTTSRRHSHSHLNLKPTSVFDHIKTKVKRKRHSHNGLNDIPPSIISTTNSSVKRSSEENKTLTESQSQPILATEKIPDRRSNRSNEDKQRIIEKDENQIDESDHEPVQWRLEPTETDIDNDNQKTSKTKTKLNKIPNNQINTKKRRSIIQCSAKRQSHKKNKKNNLSNTNALPYLMGFHKRDEDFNQIFKDLPSDEKLMIAYPCAWQKTTLMHGRAFFSVNYVCFYTCFFQWEESLCIPYKDLVSITTEKSTTILPNAIQLQTKNRDQYLFASYIPRERIYNTIYRLWQNALLHKPLEYEQLRAIVFADQISLDELTSDSDDSITLENTDQQSQIISPISSNNSIQSNRSLTQPDVKIYSSSPSLTQSNKDDTNYRTSCACDTHLTRTYAERLYLFNVDQLLDLTYGDNSFTRTYHDSQKLIDYTMGEWYQNNETGKKERIVTYKTVTQSIFGTNTISCNERQMMDAEIPHSLYIVSTEVNNEGMKYTDAFVVATRFCMFQRDAKYSSLRVTAEVRYVKSVNGIAKAFIEKNCHSSIEGGVNNLLQRLDSHQASMFDRKSNRKHRKQSKQQMQNKKSESINQDENKDISASNNTVSSDCQTSLKNKTITGKGLFFDTIMFIGIFLLLLHIFVCYQLHSIDRALLNYDLICTNECKKACLPQQIPS